MFNDKDLQQIFLDIYSEERKAAEFAIDDSSIKQLEIIEAGLVNRTDFAVSQRRFVTKLFTDGSLVRHEKAWEKATMDLTRARTIVSKFDTDRMNTLSNALRAECQRDIDDTDFERDLRKS